MSISSKEYVTYCIVALLLVLAELAYFKVAEKFNIIDKPNHRSSHTIPTIRGGGIIFLLAVLLFSVFNNWPYAYLIMGVTITGIVSFWDDIKSLSSSVRFTSHIVAVVCLFIQLTTEHFPVWVYIAGGIIALGSINMYNFMDGINGITAFYTLSILTPLLLTESDTSLLQMQIFFGMGVIIFTFFNARKRARCFAGDIGSICAAVILLFFIAQRMLSTHTLLPLGFFSIYAIDAGYTVVERLIRKENIFQPHRSHLYQLLCNELGMQHIQVSLFYATIQLMLNVVILYAHIHIVTLIGIGIGLLILYHVIKQRTKEVIQNV